MCAPPAGVECSVACNPPGTAHHSARTATTGLKGGNRKINDLKKYNCILSITILSNLIDLHWFVPCYNS